MARHWNALPTLPTWLFYLGILLAALPFLLFYFAPDGANWVAYLRNLIGDHLVTLLGMALVGLVLTAALLRAIVYFRDTYRATNFGVPDLVQIICTIDGKIAELRGKTEAENNVQLSFIGHSMGGFVVTNTIRVLSDVFKSPVSRVGAFGAAGDEPPSPNVGRAFQLKRFVLASPDIPAETLVTSRGNFLATSLTRFDEAYLFSNEGDEVLRQISTLANYFVFPTTSRNHGFRLGNVEILSEKFGLTVANDDADLLKRLRIGRLTLKELYNRLKQADEARQSKYPLQPSKHASPPQSPQPLLPSRFSYFDCTDYVDLDNSNGKKKRALLTFAKCQKVSCAEARLGWLSHMCLLVAYVVRMRPNVHGGYFEGQLSQQLIYRLACLGYADTVRAYGASEAEMGNACRDKQIRVLISPNLSRVRQALPPPPPGSAVRKDPVEDAPPPSQAGANSPHHDVS
jgi:hypothetical protein